MALQPVPIPPRRVRPRDTSTPYPGPPDPTYTNFVWWVQNVMAVPDEDVPSDGQMQWAYNQAINLAYWGLTLVPSQPGTPSIYSMAVYNLGGHFLVEFAVDDPGSTYWSDLRQSFGLNSFTPGLINSAHDQGTGEGMAIPPSILNGMTLLDLQLAKTPWGLAYLELAGQWGPIWGITF